MVVSTSLEPSRLVVARISGAVTSDDQRELVGRVRDSIRHAGAVRLLVVLELFGGWYAPPSFDDPALWLQDDEGVTKIAIAGDPAWRQTVLTMIGQPLRRIPINYFDNEAAARQWLATEADAATGAPSS